MSVYKFSFRHRAGPLDIDVQFHLTAPWTALFAPSGAGKTTILRFIAGLDQPSEGRIVDQYGVILLDTAEGLNTPSHLRQVRLVAQRPALFPHLTVLQNVTYAANTHTDQLLELCRIAHLRSKFPAQLSGGERQRVALARALHGEVGLLLLDEPFTGLESDLRDALIHDLKTWLAEYDTPVLLVTHDLGEVFAANAHVLKMESGRIVAQGPAAEVLATERDRLITRLTQNS